MACYAFQEGNCRRGGRCRFSHDSGDRDRGGRSGGYRGGRSGGYRGAREVDGYGGGRGGEDYRRGGVGDDGYRSRAGIDGDGGYRNGGRGESDRYRTGSRIENDEYRASGRFDRGESRGRGRDARDEYRSAQRSIPSGNRGGRIGSRSYRDARDPPPYLGPGGRESRQYISRERETSDYRTNVEGAYRTRGGERSSEYRGGDGGGEDVYRRGAAGRSPDDGYRGRAFRGDIRSPEATRVSDEAYLGGGGAYRDERGDRGYQTGGGGGFNGPRDPVGRGPYHDRAPPSHLSHEPPRGSREGGRYGQEVVGRPSRFDFQNENPREERYRFSPERSGRGGGVRRRGGRGRGVCYAWQKGDCTRGSRCRFSHGGARERSRSENRQQTRDYKGGRQDGTISMLNDKGYGFIKRSGGGGSLFFHSNAMSDRGTFDDLREGDRVSFETGLDTKTGRDRAENVLLVR